MNVRNSCGRALAPQEFLTQVIQGIPHEREKWQQRFGREKCAGMAAEGERKWQKAREIIMRCLA